MQILPFFVVTVVIANLGMRLRLIFTEEARSRFGGPNGRLSKVAGVRPCTKGCSRRVA